MMHSNPISHDLVLFLTQLMVALAIIVLAIATYLTRKQVERRLRTLEVHALRATVVRGSTAHVDRAIEH